MTNLPKHHPDDALLLDHACGALAGPFSLAVATHLALCPACRRAIRAMESAGGAALAHLEAPAVDDDLLTKTLSRLGEAFDDRPATDNQAKVEAAWVPHPLRGLLKTQIDRLPFKRLAGGQVHLLDMPRPYRAYLLRVAGGKTVPMHGHSGLEMTLVLSGGYSDGEAHFDRGDIGLSDEAHRHAPKADAQGCTCLIVSAGPLRGDPLTTLVARWFGI